MASNRASRGLGVPGLIYDMPAYVETYVRRIGRTARADKEGERLHWMRGGRSANFGGVPLKGRGVLERERW